MNAIVLLCTIQGDENQTKLRKLDRLQATSMNYLGLIKDTQNFRM